MPPAEQLTLQRVGQGTVDLTAAKVFLTTASHRAALVAKVEAFAPNVLVTLHDKPFLLSASVRLLTSALASLYSCWTSRHVFTDSDLDAYRHHLAIVGAICMCRILEACCRVGCTGPGFAHCQEGEDIVIACIPSSIVSQERERNALWRQESSRE